jgi:FkbM family methyltransferase
MAQTVLPRHYRRPQLPKGGKNPMLPQVNIIRANHGDFLSFFESRGISGVLTMSGAWDELTISISRFIIDLTAQRPVVFDIGANMGTYTVALAKHVMAKDGVVHAFEPQRIVYYQLCGNIFLNRLSNVFAHRLAVSHTNRTEDINPLDFYKSWNIGAYSLVPDKDPQEKTNVFEQCDFITLDTFDPKISPTLIKLDVEGMEDEVILGGKNFLERSGYPPILFESLKTEEIAERVDQVKTLLSNIGYDIIQYNNEDYLAQHPMWPVAVAINKSENGINIARTK